MDFPQEVAPYREIFRNTSFELLQGPLPLRGRIEVLGLALTPGLTR